MLVRPHKVPGVQTVDHLEQGVVPVLHRLRAVRKNDKGFTLTELLIVIVILGVLTGIVVFAVGAFADRGNEAACKTDFKAVESAAEAYRAKTGEYPTGADPLGLLVT